MEKHSFFEGERLERAVKPRFALGAAPQLPLPARRAAKRLLVAPVTLASVESALLHELVYTRGIIHSNNYRRIAY